MTQNKTYSLLGLAVRAGKAALGTDSVIKAVKSGKASLVILADDASYNTSKKLSNTCTGYNVPVYVFGGMEDLGHAAGKGMLSALALLDEGFAGTIKDSAGAGGRNGCL